MTTGRVLSLGAILLVLGITGCSFPRDGTSSEPPGTPSATSTTRAPVSPTATATTEVTALVFAFGVGAKNVLDTSAGTFTKDMILASPITVPLRLSEEEMTRIARKVDEIDLFSYPARYTTPQEGGWMEPHESYRFSVTTAQGTKVVTWEDAVSNDNEQAADLRSLARLIKRIIYARPEFKALPEPEGGYL